MPGVINLYEEMPGLEDQDLMLVHSFNFHKLQAAAFWPSDESKRDDYLRFVFRDIEAELEEGTPGYAIPLLRETMKPYLNNLGSRRELAHAPGFHTLNEETRSIFDQAQWVGVALMQMYLVAKQSDDPKLPTLNRIAHLIEKRNKIPKSSFMRTWMTYKPAAHIWAAFKIAEVFAAIDVYENRTNSAAKKGPQPVTSAAEFFRTPRGISMENTLAWAIEFQNFGTSCHPNRRKGLLLDPSEIWIIQGGNLPELRPMPVLGDETFSILQAYSAPKSYS